MKKIKWHDFTKNLGLKLIALVFSVLLWLFVSNIDNPIKSRAFNDVPITIKNEEIVTNDGKKFKIMDDFDSVRVVVHARRSVLSKIDKNDITAVVDLRQRDSDTGVVPITAVVSGYEESLEVTTETTPNNVLIRVEDSKSKSFPISVTTMNEPRDGYVLGEMTTNPERIEISGSASAIEDIQRVVAKIDVNGIYEDSVLEAEELIIFDGNGNAMDQSGLQNNLGDKGVSVNVQVLPSKEVGLKFNVSGTVAEGYRYTGLNCVPETVKVYGEKAILEELSVLEIPENEIDIEGLNAKKEYTVDISPYLPEGIQLTDETTKNVVVTVVVEKEGTRTFFLPVGAVRINNLDEGLDAEVETTGELEVHFTGDEALLEKLDIRNAASINLKEYTVPGTYEIPVNIEVDSEVVLVEKPVITVTLSEKPKDQKKSEE